MGISLRGKYGNFKAVSVRVPSITPPPALLPRTWFDDWDGSLDTMAVVPTATTAVIDLPNRSPWWSAWDGTQ